MKPGCLVVAFVLALPSAAAESDAAFGATCVGTAGPGVVRLRPKPTRAEPDYSASPACVAIDGRTRICAQRTNGDDDGPLVLFLLTRDARELQRFPGDMFLASTEDFRVLVGDLDLDGRAELIVARIIGVSNGLGPVYWRLSILDGHDWSRPPLEFEVEDFDPAGSFRRRSERESCEIVVSEWSEADDPRRGRGTYLVGHRFRYASGVVLPDTGSPVVARRLLPSFVRERERQGSVAGLASPKAERRARHLVMDGPEIGELMGTITGVADREITLRREGADTAPVVMHEDRHVDQVPDAFTRFGDLASGRPYPRGYAPADRAGFLVGRRVSVRSYPKRNERIVWLGSSAGLPAR